MVNTSIIGIDPGRIHTGCVAFLFNHNHRYMDVTYHVVQGVNTGWIRNFVEPYRPRALYIEDYNPGNYAREDKKMSEALGRLKAEFPPSDDPVVKYVDNAGINTLIPVEVQKLFGIHTFPVSTHHNDLNSAGKIALMGMLQDKGPVFRHLISMVVSDALSGHNWVVRQHG